MSPIDLTPTSTVTASNGSETVEEADVVSSTQARCNITHPRSSERYTINLSFNGQDPIGQSFAVTAFAPAPVPTAKFDDNGQCVIVV